MTTNLTVRLPKLHPGQQEIVDSPVKRKVIRAGRRFGKTFVAADIAVEAFLEGRRVMYTAPTSEQTERFWYLVKQFMAEAVDTPFFYKNESERIIERPGTTNRIRAKTAWNADTLRGDYADLVIFDEWQLTDEAVWGLVGAPMLLDNNGDAIFIYTPPSLRSRKKSKSKDPMHAAKLFKRAEAEEKLAKEENRLPRWKTFTGSSFDNPKISKAALNDITSDMSELAYRQEILAEDVDEVPGALWKRSLIETTRVKRAPATKDYELVVVGIDPSASSTGDEAGIVVCGKSNNHYYVLEDVSIQGSPDTWASAAVGVFHKYQANYIIAESNQGGEMITNVIRHVDQSAPVVLVHASRGKYTRAEPIAVLYEKKLVHHVGGFPKLEDEMCLWLPGDPSPNRMDALVWAMTYISTGGNPQVFL
jgi:hypothetical protein